MGKIKGRLFTFGCSFTRYHYPTWADILGHEFEHFENWGIPGIGNQCIFNSLIECNARNNINENDTVIIMWSSTIRQDKYINRRWQSLGDVTHSADFGESYFAEMFDFRGLLIRDLAVIKAADLLLSNKKCNYQFHSMVPIVIEDNKKNDQDVIALYSDVLEKIKPSIYEVMFNNDWNNNEVLPADHSLRMVTRDMATAVESMFLTDATPAWPNINDFLRGDYEHTRDIESAIAKYNLADILEKIRKNMKAPKTGGKDMHPSPGVYLQYIQQTMPEFSISDNTITWVNAIDQMIKSDVDFAAPNNGPEARL